MMLSILALVLSVCLLTSGQLMDEMQELEKECLGEDKFPCLAGGCITHEQYCDGQPDCPDGSDEDFCAGVILDADQCNATYHYLCLDQKKCIPNSWVCNNETDCDDGSDEKGCIFTTDHYEDSNDTCKGFTCDGNKCISKLWVCDGTVDCDDRTDEYSEENCRKYHFPRTIEDVSFCGDFTPFRERNYRCFDSSFCLLESMMCNGIQDCRDGSDEGFFCEKWHTMCDEPTNPCKGNDTECVPERYGPDCICTSSPVVKKYNRTTHLCDDIDDCAQARPQCSHQCIDKNGHFTCTCDEGYHQDKFSYLCYANGPEALLFYTTDTEIKYIKLKSKQDVLLASGVKQVHGVSYDGKYVYWVQTAQGHQAIMRAELNNFQKTTKTLITLGLEDPGDIAVDWLGGHMYFSDVQRGSISACKTDGSVCVTLRANCKQPRFVTLSVRHGKMFWADWFHRPLIMWANLDGSKSATLVDTLFGLATGLALDEPNNRLYFVDRTVRVIKLDDKQVYDLFEERMYHPYAVAVFENTVYWSDWISNSVQTSDKLHGPRQKRNLLIGLSKPVYGMHIYHPVLYNPTHNPCENHTCSHMCLASANKTKVCVCPDSMELHGNTCQYIKDYKPIYLVIGGGSWFTRIEFNVLGNPENHTSKFNIGRVQAMAFDSRRDTLYVYDSQRKTINYISMKDFSEGNTRTFLYKGLTDIVDMDYDYVTDTLYILDAGRGFIEAVSLRTRKRALLVRLEPHELLLSFCLIPEYGRMLIVIMEAEDNNEIHVDSFSLDGEDRQTIIKTNLKGPHVRARYDKVEDKVYITDDGNGFIDSIHPEGTGRENFRHISTTLISLAVADSHLFWTDRRPRLYWTSLHQAASHNIRKLDFSIFPNHTQLYVQATSLPLTPKDPLYDHPCLTQLPCSDICVQTAHALVTKNSPRNFSLTPYKCHCSPGLLNVDGQCTPLAECKADDLYCHQSNTCVYKGRYCNGVRDCYHGEDEEHCEGLTTERGCSEGQILCGDVCVDGHNCNTDSFTTTTTPASDTSEDDFSSFCTSIEYHCPGSSLCIERAMLCNGYKDCPDGFDESSKLCDTFTCQDSEYMCTSGSCIPLAFKCDRESDCPDGSDEINCDGISCGISFYECRSKECIDLRKRCDGNQDCIDMSDEEDCEIREPETDVVEPNCEEEEYACEFNRSICLPPTARCNLKIDCPGGTDELGCDRRCAPHGMFGCKQDFLCVPRHKVCDGHPDCFDGSDETPDACRLVNMTSRLYRPSILPSAECDEGYSCKNGQCIEWHEVCDGRTHCYDGSDENGRCETACMNVSCGLSCQKTPQGGQCRCPRGTIAASDGRSCTDIDECAREPPVCAQRCENTHGTYICACYDGYSLRPDHKTCKATSGELAVVYSWDNTVWSITTDGHSSIVYNDPKTVEFNDIALDMRKHRLYVSMAAAGKLVEVNSTGTDEVVTNIGKPTKMAVEWITGNVYFVDNTPKAARMRVCNVWKKKCARLQILPDNGEVTALAVDPFADRIFYCVSRGTTGIVWSTSLAGFGLTDLVPADNCTALAVDVEKKRLYLAEAGAMKITSMNYGGESLMVEVSNRTNLQGIHGLSLFEEHVYFITGNSLSVNRCTLFEKKHCEVVFHKTVGATKFVLRHENIQKIDMNPCLNFECSNLCVLAGQHGAVCLCDDGSIAKNGVCPLLKKNQLPLFNGWTSEQYESAQTTVYWVAGIGSFLILLYIGVVMYYRYASHRNALNRSYMEVRFQNTDASTATSSVVNMPTTPSAGIEFVNPLQFVKGVWDQVRPQKRPIGTAGLAINVPYEQHNFSDTESDNGDEGDNARMVR